MTEEEATRLKGRRTFTWRSEVQVTFVCPQCGAAASEPRKHFEGIHGKPFGGLLLFCLCGAGLVVRCDNDRWSVRVDVDATERRVAEKAAKVLTA